MVFDSTDTEGFGASGYVSVLDGQPVTTVNFAEYHYLEYSNELQHFTVGQTIKNNDTFQGTIHSIDPTNRRVYLDAVTSWRRDI